MHVLRHRMGILAETGPRKIAMRAQQDIPAGFVMPVHHLQLPAAFWGSVQSDGGDIRAYSDSALITGLPFDLIKIDVPNKILIGYVRLASAITTGNDYWLGVSGSSGSLSQPAVDTSLGREEVWQDYITVNNAIDFKLDRSGNHADGAVTGTVVKSGGDLLLDWPALGFGADEGGADTDKIVVASPQWNSIFTETCFFYPTARTPDGGGRMIQWEGIDVEFSRQNTAGFRWRRKGSTQNQHVSTDTGVARSAWHVTHCIWPTIGTAPTCRIDGAAPTGATILNGSGSLLSPTGEQRFGGASGSSMVLQGRWGEYRRRNDNTPTIAWLDLENDGFTDPASVLLGQPMEAI